MFVYAAHHYNHELSHYSYLSKHCSFAHDIDNMHGWIYRDVKLYYYAKKSHTSLYLHIDGHLSSETHSTTSPDHRRTIDASRSAKYEDWLWDSDSEPSLYIFERDWSESGGAPIAHVLCPRDSPEQISTQPRDSVWFDHYTTNDTDSTQENPNLSLVNRARFYVTDLISTFKWDHEDVRSARINIGSDANSRPSHGPYGIHQNPEQGM